MTEILNQTTLDRALHLLDDRLMRAGAGPVHLVVCGGAAMIALKLLSRATRDVDVVALVDVDTQMLIAPEPLPLPLLAAARETASVLGLPLEWLNNGPSRDAGGLFQMGLPSGFGARLHERRYGGCLTVSFIDRLDQIHFKLYATVDRGGYHIRDLQALQPTEDELLHAARWTLTHDVSAAYRGLLKEALGKLGYENVAAKL